MSANDAVGCCDERATPPLNGSLPAHMIDLIRDGVPPAKLRAEGNRAIWKALVRTAASARQRGWSWGRWMDVVDDPIRSQLALQHHQDGRGGRRSDTTRIKTLENAWNTAGKWLQTAEPAYTKQGAADRAILIAAEVRHFLADDDSLVTHEEALVLDFMAGLAAKLGSDCVTVSREQLLVGTELGLTALRTALKRLDGRRALTLHRRGEPRSRGRKPRANVYLLHPISLWENPVSGASTPVSGAPSPGAPAVSGAPASLSTEGRGGPGPITEDEIAAVLGADALRRLVAARAATSAAVAGEADAG